MWASMGMYFECTTWLHKWQEFGECEYTPVAHRKELNGSSKNSRISQFFFFEEEGTIPQPDLRRSIWNKGTSHSWPDVLFEQYDNSKSKEIESLSVDVNFHRVFLFFTFERMIWLYIKFLRWKSSTESIVSRYSRLELERDRQMMTIVLNFHVMLLSWTKW